MTPAATASRAAARMSPAPITAIGFRRRRRTVPPAWRSGAGQTATASGFCTPAPALFITDAGVQRHVDRVHEEVGQDEGSGEEHYRALDDRVIALVDAVEKRPTQPG